MTTRTRRPASRRPIYPILCECGALLGTTNPRDRGRTIPHDEHQQRWTLAP